MRTKDLDLIVIIALPIFTTIALLILKLNFLFSILLFFGLPSIYLSIKNKKAVKKL